MKQTGSQSPTMSRILALLTNLYPGYHDPSPLNRSQRNHGHSLSHHIDTYNTSPTKAFEGKSQWSCLLAYSPGRNPSHGTTDKRAAPKCHPRAMADIRSGAHKPWRRGTERACFVEILTCLQVWVITRAARRTNYRRSDSECCAGIGLELSR